MTRHRNQTGTPPARASFFRATVRVGLIFVVTTAYYCVFLIHRFAFPDRTRRHNAALFWTHKWAKAYGRIANLQVVVKGSPPPAGTLLCPNHLGYADIFAIAAATRSFFVSRADAADWPLVGVLVRSSGQILVSRKRDRGLGVTAKQIEERLVAGQSVCVFLEGTSTGGDVVLPFLSALLQPAIECGARVVPAALRWSSPDPNVLVAEDIAYWKDHRFPVHFWRLMGLKGTRVEVVFGEACSPGLDRKRLAAKLHKEVVGLWAG